MMQAANRREQSATPSASAASRWTGSCLTHVRLPGHGPLMAVGSVETSWALLPDRNRNAPVRLTELKQIVSAWRGPGALVLVTHGFTVENLLRIIPGQAEPVVLKPAPGSGPGGDLVGRIAAPQ